MKNKILKKFVGALGYKLIDKNHIKNETKLKEISPTLKKSKVTEYTEAELADDVEIKTGE